MAIPKTYKQDPEYFNEHALRYALLGATNEEMGRFFGVAETTFETWLQKFPDLRDAVDRGRHGADAEVAEKLFQRATGRYKHRAVKIMQFQGQEVIVPYIERFAPDVGAAQYWLNNRRGQRQAKQTRQEVVAWNSRQANEVSGPGGGEIKKVTRIEHVVVDPKKA
ncbi:MAG: helix-turn-helix domain-containing protein [Phycisphaerales bacterium]